MALAAMRVVVREWRRGRGRGEGRGVGREIGLVGAKGAMGLRVARRLERVRSGS